MDELTQPEMDEIIAYAASKGMGVIPCVNTPGHMDAILSAATALTGKDCSYSGSARTIDVTNATAVAFTQALLQKYISYFAGKGCEYFNMGADEYANDIFTSGSMGFGNLQSTGKYSYYVTYVNAVAKMVKDAKMTPMAFNDGIYFNSNTSSGTFDTDILICYWSNGWSSYTPMPAANLATKGFKLINTHGDYYWVLGKSDWQCSPEKAKGFNYKTFQGGTINDPTGSMFCIWCDYPGAGTDTSVVNNTAATIAAFGAALPKVKPVEGVKNVTRTDDTTGVSVTAPGLTGLTVKGAAAPSIDTAAEGKVLAYDVTPTTESGNYAEAASVSFKTPSGWDTSRVRGFVVNTDGTVTDGLTGVVENGSFTFTAPHFSVMGIYQLSADAPTETKDINVAVGGTVTVTVKDVNLSGIYHTENESIATVTVTGQDETPSTVTYDPTSKKYSTLAGYNTSWTKTQYFYKVDGNYYPVYAYCNDDWSFLGHYNYYVGYSKDGGATITPVVNGETDNKSIIVYIKSSTDAVPASSTITFAGGSVGDTSVTIGGVKYNIHVTEKAPDNALTDTSINLEYWITNNKVYDGSQTAANQYQTITTSTNGVITDEGVALADLAPNPANSFFDGTVTVYYWQAMRLDVAHKQTAASGVDQTAEGTTLTHIRCHGGAWQYKTADGVWHYFEAGDQLVAYYLQKTEVTKEIDTYVKDWGYGTDSTTPNTSSGNGQAALTIAVVYPDGTVSPTEGEMYSKSTTIFNYWGGRDIGIVAPVNNSNYSISKITVTDGTRKSNTSANVWYSSDTIEWNKTLNAAGKEWYDETEVWNKSSGTTPMVNGKNSNITWSAKNTAKLVLIYLESIEKETNLNVQYIDLNANNNVFHSYQIVMTYNQGYPEPTFTDKLMLNNTVIGDKGPWNGSKAGDENYLSDDAYVVNAAGTEQKFKKDITTIPGINGIYASGLYQYARADISKDGKTLRLYYDLNQAAGKTFVVDFGLPVQIPFSDFRITNPSGIKVSFDEKDPNVTKRQGNYGNGEIDMVNRIVTYTLTKTLDAKVAVPIYVTDTQGKKLVQNVYIIPASNVYYEDSLAAFTNGKGAALGADWSIVDNDGNAATEKTGVYQALEELGKGDRTPYGNDGAYDNSSMLSMGTAHKVTVTAAMAAKWSKDDTASAWPTAQFTFKGTGFDIISLTNNKSGAIFVDVYKAGEEKPTYSYIVDNYYGYNYNKDTGKWEVVNSGTENALYQIPVMKVTGLDYGEYNAVVTVFYDGLFNHTGDTQYSFWLDAIRIYDPMGVDRTEYKDDHEGYPQYIKLRDTLVDGTAKPDGTDKTVFIDGGSTADIMTTYANYGPNNEVYLMKGQAITFKIPQNANVDSIQIGAKAPDGKSAQMVVNTDNPVEISTATEMYYQIANAGGQFTITNTGDGILSLTNLKITYSAKDSVSLGALDTQEQENAVSLVRALFTAPAATFSPETFEADWGRAVRAGKRATLTVKTSADVESITVDGQSITSYTTRTQRTGWGWWSPKVTYHVFTYTITAPAQTTDYAVCAVNAEGTASEAVTATLTVKPTTWWNWWF
ncbi:glycosyl hydrolase family 20 catalytic domain protein [Oscillibacter sp. CAG:241]|nr:glycosyl hydrolase family 20 catalytic domain protein [Oscillibacter sp. CAG:241]